MNTQTQATDQVLTEEQLEAVNGGGGAETVGWLIANIFTFGIPISVDAATGGHITKAAQNA